MKVSEKPWKGHMLTGHNLRETRSSCTARYRWKVLPRERSVPACLSYIVQGNRIWLPDNPAGIRFDFPIGDVVETGGAIVICLRVPKEEKCGENVYAIDHSGNLLWRIAPQTFESRHDSFVSLSLQGSVVNLHTGDGRICRVNLRDGLQIP